MDQFQTLEDLTLERLEVIRDELRHFKQTSAYQTFIALINGRNATQTSDVINFSISSIADIFTREALLGEARESANFINIFDDFMVEIDEVIDSKTKPQV